MLPLLLQLPATGIASISCAMLSNSIVKHTMILTGAAVASTPAQSGQRYLPKSKTHDLIAPSLAKLPNALDAEYWLNKIKVQEDLGNHQVCLCVTDSNLNSG